ncbi:MAG: hypothetical protein V3T83_19890 [Acidobacteriota bacterium]
MAVDRRCIHAGGTRLLRCSPGYACIAEHRQRGASTPLVLTLFRKRWSRMGADGKAGFFAFPGQRANNVRCPC